jgi:2-phosphosulfolactate phosphatase
VRIDVALTPSPLSPTALHGRVAVVIDVFRATTSIAAALWHGARSVIPCAEIADAVERATQLVRADIVLAGERHMAPIDGFDLGNSPDGFSAAVVGGRTVVLTTTNGTRALLAADAADTVYAGSFANFAVTLDALLSALHDGRDVLLVCAGTDGAPSLEDVTCAGAFVAALRDTHPGAVVSDAAQMAEWVSRAFHGDLDGMAQASEHGRRLMEHGFAADVRSCCVLDQYPVLAVYRDRAILREARRDGTATVRV